MVCFFISIFKIQGAFVKLLQGNDTISVEELTQMSAKMFEKIVKAVIDVKKQIMIVDAPMHADQEDFLLDEGRKKYLSSLRFMQHLEYLSAGQTLRCFLASAVDVLGRNAGKSFKITVVYESKDKIKYEEKFIIDFEQFRGLESRR